jgi:rhomboid protease GluP
VASATWLHAGILHILFNMMSVRQLAPPTAELYGAGRMVIIYVVGGIAGFALSSVAGEYLPSFSLFIVRIGGAPLTLGASASISGLIGALMYYGRRSGSSIVRAEATRYVMILAFYGFLMPGIDNFAHAGGFGGGYLAARIMDPLKPERGDHTLIAIICLAVSILAIVVSVIQGLQFL